MSNWELERKISEKADKWDLQDTKSEVESLKREVNSLREQLSSSNSRISYLTEQYNNLIGFLEELGIGEEESYMLNNLRL